MSELARILARRIESEGPISVAAFMAEALGHPQFGYYARREPFGAAGDFTTAPEISQMFGELIGLWCTDVWSRLGEPSPFTLVELGPGRGTLMADAWRALDTVPACKSAAALHLVERSRRLRERQRESLAGTAAAWHDDFADVPAMPTILVANEFFDALPIEQFVRRAAGWRRRLVGLSQAPGDEARFVFVDGTETAAPDLPPATAALAGAPGTIVEISPCARRLAAELARRLDAEGGAALIVDYGYGAPAVGETLQALARHAYAAPLQRPGEVDLTAHVDFPALAAAARAAGAATWGAIPQGLFVRRLGIETRAAMLAAQASPRQRRDLASALTRLIAADQMGTLFKVLAIASPELGPPAGFVAAEENSS